MQKLRPIAASVFIGLYLSSLCYGIAAHTLNTGTGAHPAMYFVVWDMFCGWSAWSSRNQILAEGESGAYYDVGTTPWCDYRPYGSLERRHYDPTQAFTIQLAQNVLKHTDHEPITRIFVVEEAWPKRYNLSPEAWQKRLTIPQDRHVYTHTRHVVTNSGVRLKSQPSFVTHQQGVQLAKNPVVRRDAQKRIPFLTTSPLGTVNAN